MNPLYLHCIVEYIRSRGEFPFDVDDVDDERTKAVKGAARVVSP